MPDQKPASMTPVTTLVSTDRAYFQSTDGNTDKAITKDNLDTTLRAVTGVEAGANNYSHPNHTGDVTSSGDGATTIGNNAVTNVKAADMAQSTIKGRASGAGTGDPTDLTPAQARTILNVEDGADVTNATNVAAAGALMDQNDTVDLNNLSATGTASASTFLRGDNSWAVPAGSGDVSKVGTPVNNELGVWTGDGTLEGEADLTYDGTTLDINATVDADSLQARAAVVNAETASFTYALDDAGKWTTISNASAVTATIPPNASVAFPLNTVLVLEQIGAGACTWTEGAGVTITEEADKTRVTNGQPSVSYARKTGTNTWSVYGNLVPTDAAVAECLAIAVSDETTDLTTGLNKAKFRVPYDFTLFAGNAAIPGIKGSLSTVATGATLLEVDVNLTGTGTILSTKLTFDASESTTTTAATAPVLSTTSLSEDDEITIDIDAVGNTTPGRGLKIYLQGRKT